MGWRFGTDARLIAFIPAVAGGAPAWGQAAEEIIVTGERVARSEATTPSSVVVITSDAIRAMPGTDRIDQIFALIPNVQLGSGGEGPTIRGQDSNGPLRDMPAFLGGNRPRVTMQIDGRPVGYNELAFGVTGLWDVAKIEVFRSPQTTTQGRNAIAGAIFIETAAPSFDWQARARLLVGEAETRQASAAVGGPLISDALAFRASVDLRRSRPASRISSPALTDFNRDDYDSLRLKLLATPENTPGLRLSATLSHNRSAAPQLEGVRAPFAARRDPAATYGFFKVRVDAATLRADYAITSDWNTTVTLTRGDATIRRIAPPGFGEARIGAGDWTAEAVTIWRPRPNLALLTGANFTHATLEQQIDLRAALLGMGRFSDRQDALGLFGQAEWRVASALTVTAGARYQRDDQDRSGILGIGNPTQLPLDFRQRYSRFLPKVSVSFDVLKGLRVGGLVQRAYNPGGVTLDARRRIADTFDPETLWAYEAFVRLAAPNRTFIVSANIFYYDMNNAQRSVMRELPTPAGIVTVAEIGNAPAARSSGGELQGQWQVRPGLDVRGAIGLLQTRLTRTLSASDPLLGKQFQRSPHFTGTAAIDWRPSDDLRLSGQARHNSGYYSEDTNDRDRRVGGATVVDINGAWTRGPFTVSAYVRNLFDKFYLTYRFSKVMNLATAGDPREFGASVEMRF
ncbi:TonB-dependent receptor [Novosphingobium sp. Gsoil 351]|uniref:TonB-dependent receptor n=1 Tax=Novosphingobium sp. Gsoil 351 TaxID=2675225 RepID=UPI0012B4A031|nr:TonB-dependent receptor [Novosphingobium sp. Gsoil 351]QGN54959.1 TonB-dependent receptor [Novosphingobium sp. Gsoil 351]